MVKTRPRIWGDWDLFWDLIFLWSYPLIMEELETQLVGSTRSRREILCVIKGGSRSLATSSDVSRTEAPGTPPLGHHPGLTATAALPGSGITPQGWGHHPAGSKVPARGGSLHVLSG